MDSINISYRFKTNAEEILVFDIELDKKTLLAKHEPLKEIPEWVKLDSNKCDHCPLKSEDHPSCPVAVSLVDIISRFNLVVSHDVIDLEVMTEDRITHKKTTVQQGISSLIGLLIATSGCPHTAYFKPMARFHLPLACEEETMYRACSMYFLAQFFREQDGLSHDSVEGLSRVYDNMHTLNRGVANRIREATSTDSSVNALVILDAYSQTMPFVIKDKLHELKYLFESYLSPETDC